MKVLILTNQKYVDFLGYLLVFIGGYVVQYDLRGWLFVILGILLVFA